MIKKETRYVIGAFAVLLVLALIFQRQQAAEVADLAPTPRPVILFLDVAQIDGLTITAADGARVALALQEDGQWALTEPPAPAAEVDQFAVLSAISGLGVLYEQSSLSPITDLESVGLLAPEYTLSIHLVDGNVQELFVGAKTFNGGAYYVRLPGGNPQLVNLFTMDAVLDLLHNPPIPPTAEAESESEGGEP